MGDVFVQSRMDWVTEVRSLLYIFLEKYIRNESALELKIVKSKIDLYIDYDESMYSAFEAQLTHCICNPYSDRDYCELIRLCQKLLHYRGE